MKALFRLYVLCLSLYTTAVFAEDVTLAGYITNQTNRVLKLQAHPKGSGFPSTLRMDSDWPKEFNTYKVNLPYSNVIEVDNYTAPIIYSALGTDGKTYGCKFAFSYGAPIKTKALGWEDNEVHCKPGVTLVISGRIP